MAPLTTGKMCVAVRAYVVLGVGREPSFCGEWDAAFQGVVRNP